jgi:hypothetical protein
VLIVLGEDKAARHRARHMAGKNKTTDRRPFISVNQSREERDAAIIGLPIALAIRHIS